MTEHDDDHPIYDWLSWPEDRCLKLIFSSGQLHEELLEGLLEASDERARVRAALGLQLRLVRESSEVSIDHVVHANVAQRAVDGRYDERIPTNRKAKRARAKARRRERLAA